MHVSRSIPVCVVVLLVALSPVLAAEQATPEEGNAEPWQPPRPKIIDHDWVRMTSGEWLKGDLKAWRGDVIEFDSDEFDDQELDLDDVAELYTHKQVTVTMPDTTQYVGRISLVGPRLHVQESAIELDREDLVSAIPQETNFWKRWEGSLGVSLSVRDGNSERIDYTLTAKLRYRSPFNRIFASYTGVFAETNDVRIEDNHRVNAGWEYFIDDRLFITVIQGEYFKDKFANIEHRVTPSVGIGYSVYDTNKIGWDVTASMGYRYTEFVSVPEGQDDTDEAVTAIFGTRSEVELTKTTDWNFDYTVTVDLDDSDATNHNLSTTISVDITGDLDFDVTFAWEHEGKPQADENGNVPETDDYRLDVGISYEL